MPEPDDLLLEIGTEELPPKALLTLTEAFAANITQGLTAAGLKYGEYHYFASPRRLAIIIKALSAQQADHFTERRGPTYKAAFDTDGNPTKACLGFAKSCGVTVAALTTQTNDKGKWVMHRQQQAGQTAQTLLPKLIANALTKLPMTKPMRWGDGTIEFIRPVHWLVLLYGKKVISGEILGKPTGNQSYGHRFHAPCALTIKHAGKYETQLRKAYVIADFTRRREIIREQVNKLADDKGMHAIIEPDLLNEVTGLVEWPVALLANFSPDFLQVPKEVLIAAMRDHQKCFPLVDDQQQLLPHFITVANIASRQPQCVITGNERVMRARLSDAKFFFDTDKKQKLIDRLEKTRHVIFQRSLGSLYDKARRLAQLSPVIARHLNLDQKLAERAGWLAKCDLLTDMVQEFPALQGIMGFHYARHDGEDEMVAIALKEQYLPRFAKDCLAQSASGATLALAERLDHLVGMLAIHTIPKGEKDPYKLRRTALGIARIIIEKQLDLDIKLLLKQAIANYQQMALAINGDDLASRAYEIIIDRLPAYYQDQGIPADRFFAAFNGYPNNNFLLDLHHGVTAVHEFCQSPAAISLVAASKRVSNILDKAKIDDDELKKAYDQQLLQDGAEQQLAAKLRQIQPEIEALCAQKNYKQALTELATLRDPIDHFFDKVMVMDDDIKIRTNRLRLLNKLRGLLLSVAMLAQCNLTP